MRQYCLVLLILAPALVWSHREGGLSQSHATVLASDSFFDQHPGTGHKMFPEAESFLAPDPHNEISNQSRTAVVNVPAWYWSETEVEARREVAELGLPVCAILVGCVLCAVCSDKVLGMILIYFGSQSGFSLYMKVILSNYVISIKDVPAAHLRGVPPGLQLHGVPAAFFVTAFQQLTTFILFTVGFMVLWFTSCRYKPKTLATPRDKLNVLFFSLSFAASIGFNNFSLALISVSLNLTIRSCVPLATVLSQIIVDSFSGRREGGAGVQPVELVLMAVGCICAIVATLAKGAVEGQESEHLWLGVFTCVLSVFGASFNMVLATILGGKMDLNTIDQAWYMAIPSALVLLPPAVFLPHPVGWPGVNQLTDWEVIRIVWNLSPGAIGLVVLSGIFAAAYNMFQYSLIQVLAADHTAFCGNFNKAATIILAICLGTESLPPKPWNVVLLLAILGNIASFAGYTALKSKSKKDLQLKNGPDEAGKGITILKDGKAALESDSSTPVEHDGNVSPMRAMHDSLLKSTKA